ncbi:MAG: hypothetical protein E4G99_04575 [Anaerolineales bacterium]|nr:MAG: hypothetical protein E4G99_04575 [Anaerolineales bacterium]
MAEQRRSALYWAPRVIGMISAVLLGIVALDVFAAGYPFGELLVALLMHLIPSLLILVVLIIAWRWERLGGGLFILLGVLYTVLFWDPGRWVAFLIVSGPLFLAGILFLLNVWVVQTPGNHGQNPGVN